MKFAKSGFVVMLLVVLMCMVSAYGAKIRISPLTTDDGCISFTTGYPSWNDQHIDAGDEDHWLGGYWPLGGIVKFVLPAEVTDSNVTVISATLHFYTWNDTDGTSLGAKAGDNTNYPNGPFCLLQHFTTDRAAGLNAADGTATTVENIAIDSSAAGTHVYYEVGTAVQNDKLAGNVRSSFRTRAVDYTGRILDANDSAAFEGYMTCYAGQDIAAEYAACRPYLEITYLHRQSPLVTDDGCMSLTTYTAWNDQYLNAGDEDHWLGGYWPLMGIVKFVLPAEVKQANVIITEAKLHLYTMGGTDGTSLGTNKDDDNVNYPHGPFCQLRHFTTDRAAGLSSADGTAPVEDIAVNDSNAWKHVYYDVKTAVQNDITAGNVRTSFCMCAVDYTGRPLSGSTDRDDFAGYLTAYADQEFDDADSRPYLEISYIHAITASPLTTDDGCISMAAGYSSWNDQELNAGDEDHWLGGYWPLAGIVKFVLPSQIAGGTVTGATLRLYTLGNTDGTSLGSKASDSNYPNGPFCQLQHFTTGRAAGIISADGTAPVENIAIDDSPSWSSVSYDVRAAVQKDNVASNVRSSFLTRAVDYTGRILSGSADRTAFAGYLTQYASQNSGYAEDRPYLDITYIPEATTPLTIVQSGVGTTAIVIPTGPKRVEEVAAEELQYHIQNATGVTLEIYEEVNEPTTFDGLIYLGACHATARAGIDGSSLDDNGYIVRNVGYNFFLAGHDDGGEPLGMIHRNYTQIGTMLAVYRFLEDYMAVKWLWPGVNGEVIPTTTDLTADGIDIVGKPILKNTLLIDYGMNYDWGWKYPCTTYTGWTNADVRADYLDEQSLWMRRQGFCQSQNLECSHAYETWWNLYNTTHPEYFNLLPDSTLRPDPLYLSGDPQYVSMCFSNSGLRQQKVTDWVNAGATGYIQCAENDTPIKCTCTNCMAMDVQDPCLGIPWAQRLTYATNAFNANDPHWYMYLGSMSDRLARYLLAMQQKASDNGYPNATVIAFAYDNYINGPLATQLNDRVVLEVAPAFYFPWPDTLRQVFRDSWNGWHNSGAQVCMRPNYFQTGHNFPIYFADKFGSDFMYALKRDMIGTFFDSLTGQWSTQGLNLYMLARVQTHHISPNAAKPAFSMGYVVGVNSDSVAAANYGSWPQTLNGFDSATAGNTSALEMIVDMEYAKSVSAILIQNMPENGYGVSEPGDIRVYVADDESAGLASSFTHEITNGATPMNVDNRGIANAWETFTLPTSISNKRYVKISITGNNQPSQTLYQWQDIAINTIPKFPFNAEVVAIQDDFYEAFGPAEPAVRNYFNHWKAVSDATTVTLPYATFYLGADQIFTPDKMVTGRTLITAAQTAAVGNSVAVRLVDILEKGFTNVEKTLAAQAAWKDYNDHGRVWQYWCAWEAAVQELDNYRASVEDDFICNMGYLRHRELREDGSWTFTTPATNPSPADNAVNVALNPQLTWTADAGTSTHDVYFGTTFADVNSATNSATNYSSQFKGNQSGTTYTPGTMAGKTAYYWRIDEISADGGTTKGAVWTFTTDFYTEKFQDITVGAAGAWTDVDLTSYGILANQVVEIGLRNSSTSTARSAGVRTKGSSIDRRLTLRAAATTGWDTTVMQVKVDANKKIQAYAANTTDVHIILLGVWDNGDYTEKFQTLTIGTTGAWTDSAALSAYGVSANQIVEILAANTSTTAYVAGVRGNGSALDRKLTLRTSASSARECLVMKAKADAGTLIEVWKGNTAVTFTLLGYWTTAPGTYTEKFVDVGKPTSSATWYTRSLSGQGVPAYSPCEFLIANAATANADNVGVRAVGSSFSRLYNLHRSSASTARSCAMMHVLTDGSSQIQQYLQTQTDTVNFYLLGYWN